MSQFMIYGANGFTGRLIVQEALERGFKPVIAGRNRKAIKALANETGLEARICGLNDLSSIAKNIANMDVVLHSAGPFSLTMPNMVKACLQTGTHYCDITGEIDVFEKVYAQHDKAIEKNIALIPGVGFDVVPTDCVAVLAEALPDATHLALSFRALGGISRGTLQTAIYHMDNNSWERTDGELRPTKNEIYKGSTFGTDDKINFMGIPWGDLSSAYRSTAIPNIITAMATSPKQADKMKQMRMFMPIVKIKPVNALLRKIVSRTVTGPSEEKQNTSISYVYGRAKNSRGHVETRALQCCEAYRLTAKAAVHAVDQMMKTDNLKGALTPSLAFGKDFLFDVPGAKAAWLK